MTIMLDPEVVGAGADTTDEGTYTVEVHVREPKGGNLTKRDEAKLAWFAAAR